MTLRRTRIALLGALCAACAFGVSGAAPPPEAAPKPPESPLASLFKPRPFNGYDDPKLTLGEALDHLSKMYGVPIELNEEAFRQEQVNAADRLPVAEQPIPKLGSASLDRVLRKVLSRISVPGGAAYMVRPDRIEVTTRGAQVSEVWGKYEGPYLPLVHADFDGRPLAAALRDLGEQAGVSVVVDARAGDKAKAPVSASFLNLPLDTAVRVLADMAGLKSYLNDNVLYVSAEARNVTARPDANLPGDGFGGGFSPGMALNMAFAAQMTPVRGADFAKKPLREALEELLRPTAMKPVFDAAHAGDKLNAPVTANLDGTNLDAAVRLLADLAGLQAVLFDNVVYVTTKENAAAFRAGMRNRGGPAGLGGGLPSMMPGAGKDGAGQ